MVGWRIRDSRVVNGPVLTASGIRASGTNGDLISPMAWPRAERWPQFLRENCPSHMDADGAGKKRKREMLRRIDTEILDHRKG